MLPNGRVLMSMQSLFANKRQNRIKGRVRLSNLSLKFDKFASYIENRRDWAGSDKLCATFLRCGQISTDFCGGCSC